MTQLIDEKAATKMLRNGARIREVAQHFGVSTQAIYLAIAAGRIQRPAEKSAEPAGGGRAG